MFEYLVAGTLIAGVLSWNPTLERVGHVRQTAPTLAPISPSVPVSVYDCRLGVPNGYERLVGEEAWFWDGEAWHGPWLVTDVEADRHAPHMQVNGLAADVDCSEFVHQKGAIFVQH